MRSRHKFQAKKIPLADLEIQAQNAETRGDSKTALKLYEKICKDYKTSSAASEAYFFRGQWYEKDHQFSLAVKMFTKIAKYHPESPFFTQSVEHCFQIANTLQAGIRPRYFGKIPGFRDFDLAIKSYELVVKYAPFSRYAPQALNEIANLQLAAKRYDQAIDALDRIVDLYPDSIEVPSVYLKIAKIYRNLVRGEEYNQGGAVIARRHYREFIVLFPQHLEASFAENAIRELEESIVRSKISLGDFYFNSRYNKKAALKFYRLAIDFAPYTSAADQARSRIAEISGGKKPKSTPVDFLFPSYKPQSDDESVAASNDEFVAAAMVQDRIMDQKDDRVDPVSEKSVTPFVKSKDVFVSDEA
ncbi:MAG: tetratricopeptide repeat protein [Puniceicoccales bacterium]|nr:tetratricopeptide repeat protein [Puniceicoccales bacterium]